MQNQEQQEKKDFFISYNKADVDRGLWISQQLEAAGYTTVIQAMDFRPGENFVLKMQETVINTKKTIAILSDDYFTSLFGAVEWADAFGRDPKGTRRTLIPVKVRPCEPQGFFTTIIHIDLVDKEGDIAQKMLIDGVAEGRAKIGPTPFPGKGPSGTKGSSSSAGAGSVPFPKDLPPLKDFVEIFTVFAKNDQDMLQPIEDQLAHLKRQGKLALWSTNKMLAGYEIKPETERNWRKAHVILLLISANLYSDDRAYELYERALARHKEGTARVIPVLIKPCMKDGNLAALQSLPTNDLAISSWSNRQEAYAQVGAGINEIVQEVLFKLR